ncbi:hypothetical protein E4U53_008066 [Claviceps sorghi]|nr:hypothetical protein E4U53_008066 [Claviceps sorghi]
MAFPRQQKASKASKGIVRLSTPDHLLGPAWHARTATGCCCSRSKDTALGDATKAQQARSKEAWHSSKALGKTVEQQAPVIRKRREQVWPVTSGGMIRAPGLVRLIDRPM